MVDWVEECSHQLELEQQPHGAVWAFGNDGLGVGARHAADDRIGWHSEGICEDPDEQDQRSERWTEGQGSDGRR